MNDSTALYRIVFVKTVLVALLLLLSWAFSDKDTVVIYLRF
jgi:hypothetical protein